MREIIFRGKWRHTNEWVYGYYHNMGDKEHYISEQGTQYCFEVIPETIGQFTGLTDRNGVKIFEGDKVRILYTDWISKNDNDSRTLEQYLNDISKQGNIVFQDNGWYISFFSKKFDDTFLGSIEHGKHGFIEVIGNIHDNG